MSLLDQQFVRLVTIADKETQMELLPSQPTEDLVTQVNIAMQDLLIQDNVNLVTPVLMTQPMSIQD
jgi:hypothetical protein